MKTRLAKLLLGTFVTALLPPSASFGAVMLAPDGIDLQGTGLILNSPVVTSPDSVTGTGTSWEFTPGVQGLIVPVGQLTGLTPAGTAVNYEDLLPLKATKIRVMTGAAGAAPTGVSTVIDSAGIDTNSLITDALYVTDSATQQLRQFQVTNGIINLPGTIRLNGAATISSAASGSVTLGGDYGTAASNYRAVALGGWNGLATGDASVVIGGFNYTGQQNVAAGQSSMILGAKASRVEAFLSNIIGGQGNNILGGNATLSSILGGQSNLIDSTAGGLNLIAGGSSNTFTNGGTCGAIIAGNYNSISNGNYSQGIFAGQHNTLGNAPLSAIVAGYYNSVAGNPTGADSCNAVLGGGWNVIGTGAQYSGAFAGHQNNNSGVDSVIVGGALHTVSAGVQRSVVLGGFYSTNSGTDSAVIASDYSAIISGSNTVVAGWRVKAQGSAQFVIGKANLQNNADASGGKVFIIGNGTSDTARSNAFSVDWTGKVETNTVQASGKVNATQGGRFDDTVRIAPRGGLSMGTFTYEP